jgi:hypothetical protein
VLTFHLSHLRVELSCSGQTAALARTLWGACKKVVEPTLEEAYEVREVAGVAEILARGELLRTTHEPCDVVPYLEQLCYSRMHETTPEHTLFLHGAMVVNAGRPLLLLGPSGSGKSTLSLCAVRTGLAYATDEFIATDGESVWGVPRAIQFDVVSAGSGLPPWLAGVDETRYRLRRHDGSRGVVPLWSPPRRRLAPAGAAARATIVAIQRAESDHLETCDPIESMRMLHEAAYARPQLDLGALVSAKRGVRLSWADPRVALGLLLSRLT